MPKYRVTLVGTIYTYRTITLTAPTQATAKYRALQLGKGVGPTLKPDEECGIWEDSTTEPTDVKVEQLDNLTNPE